jgi:hypothetical protein
MFSVIDIVNLIQPITPDAKTYPIEFPVDSPDLAIVIDISGSQRPKAQTYTISVQVKVRAVHPSICETTSVLIRKELAKLTNIRMSDVQVVFIESINPYPLYMGKDANNNYLYSTNYKFMINEGV